MISYVITFASLMFGLLAISLTVWQNLITRHALRAQSFLTLHGLELNSSYYEGVRAIATLNYSDFETFSMSEKSQREIYMVVSFLDFVAILVEDRYLMRQNAWDIYFWAYRICNDKLLTWWLAGQREHTNQSMLFSGFERMCWQVRQISPSDSQKFDEIRYRRVLGESVYEAYVLDKQNQKGKRRPIQND